MLEAHTGKQAKFKVQAVSLRPFTAEALVSLQTSLCGFYGAQNGTGKVFAYYFIFPCHYQPTNDQQ
jgi:hypothetical protein